MNRLYPGRGTPRILLYLIAAGAALAACGGDDDDDDSFSGRTLRCGEP